MRTLPSVGCFVTTTGGGRGRLVDRRTDERGGVWWLVKLYTDKGGLLWVRFDHITVVDQ